jgi:hypothetical protein
MARQLWDKILSGRYLIDKCEPDTGKTKLLTSPDRSEHFNRKSSRSSCFRSGVGCDIFHFCDLLLLLLAVDPQTYEVTMRSGSSDQKAELLTCPAARKLTLAQRYFLF